MVGSVHFGDFSVLGCGIRGAEPAPATLPARRQHIVVPVQKKFACRGISRGTHTRSMPVPRTATWTEHPVRPCPPSPSQNFGQLTRHLSPVTRHNIPSGWNRRQPPANDAPDRRPRCTELPIVSLALILRPLAVACPGRISPKNKNGVFHVKHAARFPPASLPIRPFSSPTRGTSRSRVDSAQVRPPALPAQIRLSPAHSRNRRSAVQPVRSARSAASPRPYRATR